MAVGTLKISISNLLFFDTSAKIELNKLQIAKKFQFVLIYKHFVHTSKWISWNTNRNCVFSLRFILPSQKILMNSTQNFLNATKNIYANYKKLQVTISHLQLL